MYSYKFMYVLVLLLATYIFHWQSVIVGHGAGPEPTVWPVRFWPDHFLLGARTLLVNAWDAWLGIGICNETTRTKLSDHKY